MFDYEKCQYCGSEEVKYNPLTDEFVKCLKCGQTLRVASFEREHLRIGEQIEARQKAEEDLRKAQQEKQAAQKQLGDAVSALAGIQSAQESGMQALTELLTGQSDAKFGQQEIMGFMQAVRQEGRQGQDTLTCLMQAAIRNQSTSEEKLNALQGLAQDILAAGDNLADLVQACVQYIQTGKEEQNALISQMISWSKETHQEDIQRLESIQRASHALQDSVGNIDRKVDETRQALDDLRGTLEEDKRNKLVELYHQANNALFEQRFEDASKKYMEVLAGGGKDAEVYWRIVLCHYCVEYQWDDEARLIPTLINPDLTEPERITARLDLERCISGTPQAEYYHQRLKDIDWILDRYRRVKDQMQYDVFISVKQSFENHRTLDSDIASDLYDHLKGLGLRVFNSRRSKKDIPLGKDAEPYIISALLSSRVLIVVGTSHDFMNAQWVRNEWSRFQWLMKKEEQRMGKSQRELFCYLSRDMSPYDIPRGLNPSKQAVIDGGDAYTILDQALGQIFPLDKSKQDSGNGQKKSPRGHGETSPSPFKLLLSISPIVVILVGYGAYYLLNGNPLWPLFPTPTKYITATSTVKPLPTLTEYVTATPTVKPLPTPTEYVAATPTVKPLPTPTKYVTATPTVKPLPTPTKYVTATPTNKPVPKLIKLSVKQGKSSTVIHLDWDDVANAYQYKIYYLRTDLLKEDSNRSFVLCKIRTVSNYSCSGSAWGWSKDDPYTFNFSLRNNYSYTFYVEAEDEYGNVIARSNKIAHKYSIPK